MNRKTSSRKLKKDEEELIIRRESNSLFQAIEHIQRVKHQEVTQDFDPFEAPQPTPVTYMFFKDRINKKSIKLQHLGEGMFLKDGKRISESGLKLFSIYRIRD